MGSYHNMAYSHISEPPAIAFVEGNQKLLAASSPLSDMAYSHISEPPSIAFVKGNHKLLAASSPLSDMTYSHISDPPAIAFVEGNHRLLAASSPLSDMPYSHISDPPSGNHRLLAAFSPISSPSVPATSSKPPLPTASTPKALSPQNFVYDGYAPAPTPSFTQESAGTRGLALTALIVSLILVCLVIGCGILGFLWWRKQKHGGTTAGSRKAGGIIQAIPSPQIDAERRVNLANADEEMGLSSYNLGLRKFSYNELKLATQNFDNSQILGSGGFGSVFRGTLQGEVNGSSKFACGMCKGKNGERQGMSSSRHQVVAVKRISNETKGGFRGFKAELTIISDLRHRNLVRLHGWGEDKGWLFLVYEYMPNGSLDTILHNDEKCSALDWTRRFNICLGLASSLLYLHEECDQIVLHRDIKSSNVLLDENFNAKLGDFGLSRLLKPLVSGHDSMLVAGTRGYMALEIFHTGRTTKQSDVFAFGAVLAELGTGRKPLFKQVQQEYDETLLVDWIWDLHSQGRLLDTVDKRLQGNYDVTQVMRVMIIALACSHPDPKLRPSIRSAVDALYGTIPLPSIPSSKPKIEFSPLVSISEASTTDTSASNDANPTHGSVRNNTTQQGYMGLPEATSTSDSATTTSNISSASYATPMASSLEISQPIPRSSSLYQTSHGLSF